MSLLGDREVIVSGFSISILALVIGIASFFSIGHRGGNYFSYGLVATGVVLFSAAWFARMHRAEVGALRIVLGVVLAVLVAGLLFGPSRSAPLPGGARSNATVAFYSR